MTYYDRIRLGLGFESSPMTTQTSPCVLATNTMAFFFLFKGFWYVSVVVCLFFCVLMVKTFWTQIYCLDILWLVVETSYLWGHGSKRDAFPSCYHTSGLGYRKFRGQVRTLDYLWVSSTCSSAVFLLSFGKLSSLNRFLSPGSAPCFFKVPAPDQRFLRH